MNHLSVRHDSPLRGFSVASAFAGLVFAAGIKYLVAGLGHPLSVLIMDEFNSLVKRSYPDFIPTTEPLSLGLTIANAASGVVLCCIGIVLALKLVKSFIIPDYFRASGGSVICPPSAPNSNAPAPCIANKKAS